MPPIGTRVSKGLLTVAGETVRTTANALEVYDGQAWRPGANAHGWVAILW